MSVCAHDPHCPGFGPVHDKAGKISAEDWQALSEGATFLSLRGSRSAAINTQKDRSLRGKKRRKARRS